MGGAQAAEEARLVTKIDLAWEDGCFASSHSAVMSRRVSPGIYKKLDIYISRSFSWHSGVVSLLSGVMSAAGQLHAIMFWILRSYCLRLNTGALCKKKTINQIDATDVFFPGWYCVSVQHLG